jgi:hypothetical protein
MLATTESTAMGFPEVSTILWREREALQLLLFKLVEERLILEAGQIMWLPQANEEVEIALERMRAAEVLRAAEVDAIAHDLGIAELPSLAELAQTSPEPWATVFTEHRQALLKLVADVSGATDDSRILLVAGARSVRETLLSVTHTVDTYDARGAVAAPTLRPMLMDEQA